LGVGEEFYVVNGDGAGSCAESEEVEVESGLGGGGDLSEIDRDDATVVTESGDGDFIALMDDAVGLDVEEGVGVV
jgi:hypothetical protein